MQIEALTSQSHTGEPLVDSEGFPRSDMDVHAIRDARSQLSHLQTDHQQCMKEIEKMMLAVHAEAKAAKLAANPNAIQSVPLVKKHPVPTNSTQSIEEQIRATHIASQQASTSSAESSTLSSTPSSYSTAPSIAAPSPSTTSDSSLPSLIPFYRVASVSPDSPAEIAGLRVDDLVLQFGSVNKSNVSPSSMANVVASSIGRAITVIVDRAPNNKRVALRLIPQQWGGRGMLGSDKREERKPTACADIEESCKLYYGSHSSKALICFFSFCLVAISSTCNFIM